MNKIDPPSQVITLLEAEREQSVWEVPLGRGRLFWNKPLCGLGGTLRGIIAPGKGVSTQTPDGAGMALP